VTLDRGFAAAGNLSRALPELATSPHPLVTAGEFV